MNDGLLISCLSGLVVLALAWVLYPLRKKLTKGSLVVIPGFVLAIGLIYWHWGSWPQWHLYTQEEAKRVEAKALLAKMKSPAELAEKLRARLDDSPKSARGWYLLGRIYVSQNQWPSAGEAFAKAHHLNPDDELATVNYAHALWQLNQQKFTPEIQGIFITLLEKNPNQPDALAMLAMEAYQQHEYRQAEIYWRRLLRLAPENSEEAKALRKAIASVEGKV